MLVAVQCEAIAFNESFTLLVVFSYVLVLVARGLMRTEWHWSDARILQ